MDKNKTFLTGANAPYVAELYFKFQYDKESIDSSWVNFFNNLNEDEKLILNDFRGPSWKKRNTKIIHNLDYKKIKKTIPDIDSDNFRYSILNSIRALRLIRAYRMNGHLIANLDPLKINEQNNY